jgi:thiopeptide-type bacteriocin biosynthesis protein
MKRDFCIGSEWLYYKLYTVKTADLILLEKLYSILELKEKNLIIKWFFIRYKDTDEHF